MFKGSAAERSLEIPNGSAHGYLLSFGRGLYREPKSEGNGECNRSCYKGTQVAEDFCLVKGCS